MPLAPREPHSPASPGSGLQTGTAEFRRANLALATGGFTCFALLYGTQPVLPQLTHEFAISPATASLSVAAGTLAMALLLIPLSLIADRYGRERLMRFGLFGAALFACASALMPNFLLLLFCRAALGACIAGVPAAAMAYLGEEMAPNARGRAMGLYIAANALGGMSGRFLAALVTDWWDWRHGLAALGLLGVLAAYTFWRLLPPARHFTPRSLEPKLLLGDVGRIYADPGLPWLFVTAFLIMGSFVGLYNYLGFRLSLPPYGLGPAAIGAIFLLYAVGSASSALAGQLVDRLGRSRIVLLMSLCMALGIGITLAPTLPLIIFGLAVFTFGYFAVHAVASGWVGRRAGPRRGLVSALYLSSYYLGGGVIGSATGWPWIHGGWPGVAAALLGCVAAVVAIAVYLSRIAES
ncbi:MAG TPA: MFS transporter [Azospira sp.]|nr:MFS transporter [Azospira sp.]